MLEHVGTDSKSLPEQLAAVAAERFPLARQLLLSEGPTVVPQPLPLIVSLIASILESIDRPCCLVFPAHEGIAVATSTLLALTRLQRESADLLRAHAATSFHEPDLVLVNPSNLVYEYQGFFQPNFFRLKVLDKNESRSLPVHEVARLEKTARKRPKGYLNSDLGTPQPTLLGYLAGIPGYVNRNILRTYVVVLGSKKGFRAEVETWIASALGHERSLTGLLEREIPFGEITPQGSIEFFDSYVAAGEPLVAFASHPEHLATFCNARPLRSTSIIVDDIEKLAGSLHVYDAVADRQPLLVLADESQMKVVVELQKRGCDIWQFSPDEILLNDKTAGYSGLLRPLLVRASHRQNLVISALPCTNETLRADTSCSRSCSLVCSACTRPMRNRIEIRSSRILGSSGPSHITGRSQNGLCGAGVLKSREPHSAQTAALRGLTWRAAHSFTSKLDPQELQNSGSPPVIRWHWLQ